MKKTLLFLFISSFFLANGQQLSGYQYLSVPEKFSEDMNHYGLKEQLVSGLQAKGYTVLPQNSEALPSDKCLVARVILLDDSSWLRNKVKIEAKDCHDKIIAEYKGRSMYKEFKKGFKDALKKSLALVPPYDTAIVGEAPRESSEENEEQLEAAFDKNEQATAATDKPVAPEEEKSKPTKEKVKEVVAKPVMHYTNGRDVVQRIDLSADGFMLISDNSSTPYAVFKQGKEKGKYRVKMGNGQLGYAQDKDGDLIIKLLNKDLSEKEIILQKVE